jgi:hypothetical protein
MIILFFCCAFNLFAEIVLSGGEEAKKTPSANGEDVEDYRKPQSVARKPLLKMPIGIAPQS